MTVVTEESLAEAMERCRDVTRTRARNFYYGLKLAPEPKRSALYCIYAWMRKADDLVDDAGEDVELRRANVETFRAMTEAALAGEPADEDPIWIGLRHVVDRFGIDAAHFDAMIDGQLDDLEIRRYETFEDLHEYCYRVASTVGLICITVWGYHDPRAEALATERGIAFQLTNIIRDFREDFDMGRVYLPQEDFRRHDLAPDDLRTWSRPDASERFVIEQIGRAESFYERAAELDDLIDPSCAPALWAMTAIYRGILDKIRRAPNRIIDGQRVSLSPIQKSAIALQAKWRSIRTGIGTPSP